MSIDDNEIQMLVEASASGDAESYRQLYEQLIDRVYSYIRYRTTTEERAVDLTQDVFVGLYAALPNFTYRSRAAFYAYVFQIVRRTLARHYGDKHIKADTLRTDIEEEALAAREVNREVVSDMERALQTLDPIARDIVTLHHWSGYTFAEIGAMLDMTESATRVRHHRAMHTLKAYFNNTPYTT